MGKYLVLWEVDKSRLPISPKERGAGWGVLMKSVGESLKEGGIAKSWGAFVGETRGYVVWEASELEVLIETQKYTPWITFETHPIATADQVNEMIKELTK